MSVAHVDLLEYHQDHTSSQASSLKGERGVGNREGEDVAKREGRRRGGGVVHVVGVSKRSERFCNGLVLRDISTTSSIPEYNPCRSLAGLTSLLYIYYVLIYLQALQAQQTSHPLGSNSSCCLSPEKARQRNDLQGLSPPAGSSRRGSSCLLLVACLTRTTNGPGEVCASVFVLSSNLCAG